MAKEIQDYMYPVDNPLTRGIRKDTNSTILNIKMTLILTIILLFSMQYSNSKTRFSI